MARAFRNSILSLVLIFLFALPRAARSEEITSKDQLNRRGIRIGYSQGSIIDNLIKKELPHASVIPYTDLFLGYQAVADGKLDAFVYDRRQMEISSDNGQQGVRLLDETLEEGLKIAVGISAVSEIPDLEDKVNGFIEDIREDGTLDEMYKRWVMDENEQLPEILLAEDPEYHLTVGTTGTVPPYSYYKDNALNGFDIELAYRFAAWLGADPEFDVYDYGSIIPAAAAGKIDCIMANLQVNDARRENMIFSDVLFEEREGIMVQDSSAAVSGGREASGIASSFEKTFIREGRWKMIAEGIGNTLIITLLSVFFGTGIGFLLFLLWRNGVNAVNSVMSGIKWVVQGMPMVVMLMVLFYIVFGDVDISGLVVAVIGFSLTFGFSVFGLLRIGVDAVGKDQFEAAYALGYSRMRAFFRVILPQALPPVIPAYKGEIVGLLKATSIVGYIAVQDLTKMGDIIRSRTYEAFFPLIAVTVIYFLLELLLGLFVDRIQFSVDTRNRKPESILSGVDTRGMVFSKDLSEDRPALNS